ncbi:tensin-4-like [Pholidichthys leucotaenia]
MMPTVKGMSHIIPSHVLRVGQTVCLESAPETTAQRPTLPNPDLEISLENLNKLILELDPTFEPIPVNKSPSCVDSPTDLCSDEDLPNVVLVPRGCSPDLSPAMVPSGSPSIPIPRACNFSCSPHGSVVFSSSPTASLPPLPCGSVPKRIPSSRNDTTPCSLRLSHSNRNSAISLLSTSTCSDTSYILGSNLSLTGEDSGDSPETPGPFTDGFRASPSDSRQSPEKLSMTRPRHLQDANGSLASPSGSLTDIPVLLINGAPQPDHLGWTPEPEIDLTLPVSNLKPSNSGFQARFSGSQPSMKFVMDTSKFWFRPHIGRAEAEALIKDKEAGAFVIRDSTSYRGSFGLAMKVDQTPTAVTPAAYLGESSSDVIRHFLIESSAKGVRIKGSSQEPYFGSLSALVYQHTISAYALPCRLLLHSQDLGRTGEKTNEKAPTEDTIKTACNFVYLTAVPTEMLTGPCAVQRAVTSTLDKAPGSFTPAIVNMKVSLKGVTLTDINRKLFFRRHYPAHLLSYGGEDPDSRRWTRGSSFGARMFGFVAKGVEASMENVCHVFAEYDPLQPCSNVIEVIQAAVSKP